MSISNTETSNLIYSYEIILKKCLSDNTCELNDCWLINSDRSECTIALNKESLNKFESIEIACPLLKRTTTIEKHLINRFFYDNTGQDKLFRGMFHSIPLLRLTLTCKTIQNSVKESNILLPIVINTIKVFNARGDYGREHYAEQEMNCINACMLIGQPLRISDFDLPWRTKYTESSDELFNQLTGVPSKLEYSSTEYSSDYSSDTD